MSLDLVAAGREFLVGLAGVLGAAGHARPARALERAAAGLTPAQPAESLETPVRRWLGPAVADSGEAGALAAAWAALSPQLPWRQTYRAPQVDQRFLENYGYQPLLGLGGPLAGGSADVGALLLGPRTLYPPHAHPADEWYVLAGGRGEWRLGQDPGAWPVPGGTVAIPSGCRHAMATGDQPCLAYYVWLGDLTTNAVLCDLTSR